MQYRHLLAWLILILNIAWGFFRFNHLFAVDSGVILNPGYQEIDYPHSILDLVKTITNNKWFSNLLFIAINIIVSSLIVYLYTESKRQVSYVLIYFLGVLFICGITAIIGVSLDLPSIGLFRMIKFYKDLMLSPLIAAIIILFQKFQANFN